MLLINQNLQLTGPSVFSLTWTSPQTNSTPTFSLLYAGATAGMAMTVQIGSLGGGFATITQTLASNAAGSGGTATFTAATALPNGTYNTRANINGGAYVAGPSITIAAAGGGGIPAKSSISADVAMINATSSSIVFAVSAPDFAAGQVSNISLSASNAFPVGPNTITQSETLTGPIIDNQQTANIGFARPPGTYFAKHWRSSPTGVISPDSDTLIVVVPAVVGVAYAMSDAVGQPFAFANATSWAQTLNVGLVPASGKNRYGVFTIGAESLNSSNVTSVSINGVAATFTTLWGATGGAGFAVQAIVEIPVGTTANVAVTLVAGTARAYFSVSTVTIAASMTLAVDARYLGSSTTSAVAVAPAILAGQLAILSTIEKFGAGPSAVPVETWNGATGDQSAVDNPGNLAASIGMISAAHGVAGGTMTALTLPAPAVTDHRVCATVLKAV